MYWLVAFTVLLQSYSWAKFNYKFQNKLKKYCGKISISQTKHNNECHLLSAYPKVFSDKFYISVMKTSIFYTN